MRIICATEHQFEAVRGFYHALIDGMRESPYPIGWEKDVYPAPEFLRESIENGEFFLGMDGDEIAAAMVLNHACNDGYRQVRWGIEADAAEITVVHALGVRPSLGGRGLGGEMVKAAVDIAKANGQKAIRLDVLGGNLPAERLYVGFGFKHVDTMRMFYEDTGWTDYKLYERLLPK